MNATPRLVRLLLGACPALLLCAATGCTRNEAPLDDAALQKRREANAQKLKVPRTPLPAQGHDGIVRGRVVYDGKPPVPEVIRDVNVHPEKDACLKGGLTALYQESWVVAKEGHGVANVIVFLDPPLGKYYSLTREQTNRQGEVVVLDQPHCAFVPHVLGLFPAYYDGTSHVPTGQVLELRNTDTVKHSIQSDQTQENDALVLTLPPNEKKQVVLNVQKRPRPIGCGDHKWMIGYVWPFEHPYFVVTDRDGRFEIKDVPTGVELTLKAWHEWRRSVFEERKLTLQKGENPPLELKVSK